MATMVQNQNSKVVIIKILIMLGFVTSLFRPLAAHSSIATPSYATQVKTKMSNFQQFFNNFLTIFQQKFTLKQIVLNNTQEPTLL